MLLSILNLNFFNPKSESKQMSNSHISPVFSSILATISGGSVTAPEVAQAVDQLGALDAQIKALTKQAETLKAAIKAQGPERYKPSRLRTVRGKMPCTAYTAALNSCAVFFSLPCFYSGE